MNLMALDALLLIGLLVAIYHQSMDCGGLQSSAQNPQGAVVVSPELRIFNRGLKK